MLSKRALIRSHADDLLFQEGRQPSAAPTSEDDDGVDTAKVSERVCIRDLSASTSCLLSDGTAPLQKVQPSGQLQRIKLIVASAPPFGLLVSLACLRLKQCQ